MKYGSGRDPYLNQEGVLKNKLGAKTEEELKLAETIFVLRKLTLLLQKQIEGKFDLAHLKAIHKFLFDEVYEWAGELRTISISKGSSMFALPLRIEPEANKLFAQLKAENYLRELALEPFIQRLAFYWGELNMLHPFREGNGRTQRAFLILLARQAGYQIHFGQLSPEENIKASIKSQRCDYSLLEQIIRQRIKQL
ncbi:Fic/DOC family protein [Glaesserella parasuis]|uniref:Fic/DOC family protein n=1 Tax=Glaesserella parasuis TaxID=738 RepID=UPI0024362C20|nr:Fic family protein [Glaesserella parasuis]MDG6235983.1 Fic family protein [Glaesserella parasuis]